MPRFRVTTLVLLLLALALLAACGGDSDTGPAAPSGGNAATTASATESAMLADATLSGPIVNGEYTTAIKFIRFEERIVVPLGTTVTWVNDDRPGHTVTAGEPPNKPKGQFGSDATIARGESWSHTFSEAGTYNYYCTFHPSATGVVIVTP